MESAPIELNDAASARSALDGLTADRGRLAKRITTETWWTAPAHALAVAVMIAAPTAGIVPMLMLNAASIAALLGIEQLFRKRTGMAIPLPAGPASWAVIGTLAVMILSAFGYLLVNSLTGDGLRFFTVVVVSFFVLLIGFVLYDWVYVRDLRRVG